MHHRRRLLRAKLIRFNHHIPIILTAKHRTPIPTRRQILLQIPTRRISRNPPKQPLTRINRNLIILQTIIAITLHIRLVARSVKLQTAPNRLLNHSLRQFCLRVVHSLCDFFAFFVFLEGASVRVWSHCV